MNETTLRELLNDVASETPWPTEVDSYVAAETAQQQRRRRHRLILAGAAALVVLMTLGSVALAVLTDSRPVRPATSIPTSATPTVVAPSAFDPARLRLEPGWLPDGFDKWSVEQEGRGARYTATKSEGTDERIVIYVAARGLTVPDSNEVSRMTTGAGPDINGAGTTWIPREFNSERTIAGEFRFRWTTEANASVDVQGVDRAREVAVRIAESLRVGVGEPVPLPFTTIEPKVPLTRLDISFGNNTSSLRMMYLSKKGVGPGFEFQLNTNGVPETNKQIGPWPVSKQHVSGGEYHYLFRADPDTTVMVVTRPEPGRVQEGIDLAERAIEKFVMTGDIRDPSSWK